MNTKRPLLTRYAIIFSLLFTLLTACKTNSSSKVDDNTNNNTNSETAKKETPLKEEEGTNDQGDAPPGTDYYKTIPFGKLSAKERTIFVKIAKAELCPCDGATVSLDQCLKDKKTACDIALATAAVAIQSIRQGNSESDTLAAISEVAAELKKEHKFNLEDRPFKGAKDPKVTIVEFADYQCPFCKIASEKIEKIAAEYKDKPVAFYYKHYPLPMHEFGQLAAQAAVAAQNQGKFWEMSKLLFQNQTSLSKEAILKFAKELGLNLKKFEADLNNPKTLELIDQDKTDGENANLQGTPTFYINGRIYTHSPDDTDALKATIDQLLEK